MVLGLGDIIQGVGLAANIFGSGKEKVNTTPTGGYETLPQYLKDAYEKVYYPAVQKQFERPFQMEPTVRYQEQDPLFRSQALSNYQALSDDIGGLFPKFEKPNTQPQGTQTDDLTNQPTQSAGNIDELKARAIRELTIAGQAGKNTENRDMQTLSTLMGMDGYKNEYTGTQFDLAKYLQSLGDYYSEVNSGGVNSGLVSTQYSDKAKAAQEIMEQEYWNALKRPKKMNLVAPLAIAAITGGLGAFGGAGALASGLSSGKALSGAAQLAQMAAGK